MGQLLDGKLVAASLKEETLKQANELREKGIIPKLTIVRVGAKPSDLAYERGALKRMEACNIDVEVKELDAEISQDDFVAELKKINEDPATHGILIFSPLPEQLNDSEIKYLIAPEKDVDCLSPINVAKMNVGDPTGLTPCTPTAVMEILKYYDINPTGKDCTVVGASNVVGRPVFELLLNEMATVTICHIETKDTSYWTKQAEILVVAVGVPKLVKESWVSEGTIVVDVGINFDKDGKMCGDVDFDNIVDKASMITPVPGGVGSVTTSVLAKNVIKACKQQNGLN
ncbi:bifunctional 5,10-methylenetetrahydrofolate dehydrogenase/5,10-methenyltetrahydrofolate cyclohydrolase [Alkalibacter mobilis]|uniref:bifunctional 5,10-methylenetetrahydrofolate dehydrogenase/5,10-methenyltetrahydrofolate cyclohydrolase n=1 Tax=Alkalibacter mobilis TaxID=2787712 RepID=UPI00189F4990|nr:tetrahydrofolate dehydrogenase/cyclohydrolase catalytic domain-containing protein [Alkalibacter mobilis]MBF7096888.1 bifunctional 5,10-methylene-tetrahydrofolate dehydrogenase/5,10-methylene-tetrahydrofolate cyclohydrolase [Alkalibacter mobilis]